MIFPLIWMIATSLKVPADAFTLNIIPKPMIWDNYAEVFNRTPFSQWVRNSIIVATLTTISVCFFDTVIGYILAKFSFFGKKLIFVAILSTLMVPTSITFDDSGRYLNFSSELKDSSSWVLIMTGASLSVIPLIVTFFIFQKQIIRGIALTGLK